MALCCRNPDFVFIHIYRTGGMSIRDAIGTAGLKTFEIGGWHWSYDQVWAHCLRSGLGDPLLRWFDRAFKFTVVRNPFDWLVSLYHHRGGSAHLVHSLRYARNFEQFVLTFCAMRSEINDAAPRDANQVLSLEEFIGPPETDLQVWELERLRFEWPELRDRIGINTDLPHINQGSRKWGYRNQYTDRARSAVERHFAADLERFGYAY